MIVLETERLVIRHLTLNDAPFILELLNDPSFLRFIGDRGVRSLQDARQYLLNGPIASYRKFGFGLYLTFLKDSGDPVGICGLLKRDTLKDVDLGFAFLPGHRRKGYAFESATAMLAQARAAFGLKRVLAITSPDNDASIKLLEKLGLKKEGLTELAGDDRKVELFGIRF